MCAAVFLVRPAGGAAPARPRGGGGATARARPRRAAPGRGGGLLLATALGFALLGCAGIRDARQLPAPPEASGAGEAASAAASPRLGGFTKVVVSGRTPREDLKPLTLQLKQTLASRLLAQGLFPEVAQASGDDDASYELCLRVRVIDGRHVPDGQRRYSKVLSRRAWLLAHVIIFDARRRVLHRFEVRGEPSLLSDATTEDAVEDAVSKVVQYVAAHR
ncbi:MAG: hypothetical protein KatS3mg102_1031 [Planctomycetota bacterium]|nr:MAG: hypothetical protein KatS3mg102_1031 [Planctomycetota bacterium]